MSQFTTPEWQAEDRFWRVQLQHFCNTRFYDLSRWSKQAQPNLPIRATRPSNDWPLQERKQQTGRGELSFFYMPDAGLRLRGERDQPQINKGIFRHSDIPAGPPHPRSFRGVSCHEIRLVCTQPRDPSYSKGAAEHGSLPSMDSFQPASQTPTPNHGLHWWPQCGLHYLCWVSGTRDLEGQTC